MGQNLPSRWMWASVLLLPCFVGSSYASSSSNNSTDASTQHEEHNKDAYVIAFIFGCCVCGALARTLLMKLPIPYTVLLMVLGAILGLIAGLTDYVADYTTAAVSMDPHLMLHIFLPVLIFESAFAMDVHTFMKSFAQVCILAVCGLIVAAVMTATLTYFVFSTYGWEFPEAMMFGAVASATDPVAVVALLKDLGASKQLGTLIEGESLLNDGCSIVVFEIFRKMAAEGGSTTVAKVLVYFVKAAIGGPFIGFIMGKVTTIWLSYIFNDALVEITITLASTYLTFYIGEAVRSFSGVIAVVVLGLIVNAEKTAISPEVEVFLHRFWEMLAYLANTLIFMLVGVLIVDKALANVDSIDWFYVITLYVGINTIRFFVIGLFSPILRHLGYGLTWRNAVVLTWGGLRGAVGLAMALLVVQTKELDFKTIGSKVLFHTSGIVALTLLVNATTIKSLLSVLGMSDISIPKRLAMASAVRRVEEGQHRNFAMLKADRFLADADWSIAERACTIQDPYKTDAEEMGYDDLGIIEQPTSTCPKCSTAVPNEPTQKEYADMLEETRLRMLKASKVSYWKQFEHGMLTKEAVRILVGHTESVSDIPYSFLDVDELKKNWEVTGIYPYLKRKLTEMVKEKRGESIPEPAESHFLQIMYKVSSHWILETIIISIIVLNLIPIIIGFIVTEDHPKFDDLHPFIRFSNFGFTFAYVVEAVIKIMGFRKYYFLDHWCQFDLFILVLSFVDIIVDETIENSPISPSILRIARLGGRVLRGLRMLRLFKVIIPKLIIFVNTMINKKLSLGYDIGKGFIIAAEEVSKLLEGMSDNVNIKRELKKQNDNLRLEIVRELGMVQREHPGIAVSVKTRQSIRSVLNHSRDTIRELQGAGLLDEMEAHKLEKLVEVKMKRLMNAPASIPPPRPEELLKNVVWLAGDQKLINFVKSKAELLHYDYNEVIIREGDQPNGIYLIVSGMVRLHGTGEHLDHEMNRSSFSTSTDEVFEDYLSVGNVIGEMGVLTGRPRNATVTCETAVMVYYINLEDMMVALDTFTLEPSLESRLWHVIAIRIATPLLLQQISYQGWTQEKVKLHLEKGYLPNISGKTNAFDINDTMEDVILIQGTAINAHTRDEIMGPCVIPRTVHRLLFSADQEVEPRLLVVAALEANANAIDDVGPQLSSLSISLSQRSMASLVRRRSHASDISVQIQDKKSHSLLEAVLNKGKNRIAPIDDMSQRPIYSPAPMHSLPPRNLQPLIRTNQQFTSDVESSVPEET
ncbi:Sodium/hydrogen exchanger 10 [Holothuria leucospilota]|uniref:Sodium/hydrogen exchanger 10 n=1 Tax=Holothuria leucospilota TaxID=206669 RepID=A0A9Q0YQ99_HOLLE|nr:Sodium/hydrogen exchanger 10 [Holothuria leucospilota]